MYDDIAEYNKERWEELARSGVMYSKPYLDLTPESARAYLDPTNVMDDPRSKDVLCLAGGGGQQTAAYAMLGARVTALDISEVQLERCREAAAHYGHDIELLQGDMRDLSVFEDGRFDIIFHAHSIGFIPDLNPLFDEVTRVLRDGGQYSLGWSNPMSHRIEGDAWTGKGYAVSGLYEEGREQNLQDPYWEVGGEDNLVRVRGPREFLHTLSGVMNGLCQRGYRLLSIREFMLGDGDAEPGSWEHFCAVCPPFLETWWRLEP